MVIRRLRLILAASTVCAWLLSCTADPQTSSSVGEDAGSDGALQVDSSADINVPCLDELRTFMDLLYAERECTTASDCKFVGTANIPAISEHCSPGFYVNKNANLDVLLAHAQAYATCTGKVDAGCFSTPPEPMCFEGRCYADYGNDPAACMAHAPSNDLCAQCLCGACADSPPCFGDDACMEAYDCAVDKCLGAIECAFDGPDNPCWSVVGGLSQASLLKYGGVAYCARERGCAAFCLPAK